MATGDYHTKWDASKKVFDEVIHQIDHDGIVLDTDHDIPYLGGISIDGKTVYRDRLSPSGYTSKKFKWVDTDKYLMIHEHVEKIFLDRGWSYLLAHQLATQVEYAAVKNDGYDLNEYDKTLDGWYKNCMKRPVYEDVPENLEQRPYIETKDLKTLNKMSITTTLDPEPKGVYHS